MIDHSGVNDGARPSGSHKKQEADHHIWLRRDRPFSRKSPDGYSYLVVVKDRSGDTAVDEVLAVLRTQLGGPSTSLQPVPPPTREGGHAAVHASSAAASVRCGHRAKRPCG